MRSEEENAAREAFTEAALMLAIALDKHRRDVSKETTDLMLAYDALLRIAPAPARATRGETP